MVILAGLKLKDSSDSEVKRNSLHEAFENVEDNFDKLDLVHENTLLLRPKNHCEVLSRR